MLVRFIPHCNALQPPTPLTHVATCSSQHTYTPARDEQTAQRRNCCGISSRSQCGGLLMETCLNPLLCSNTAGMLFSGVIMCPSRIYAAGGRSNESWVESIMLAGSMLGQ